MTFASEEGVDAVFTGGSLQSLHDKPIEIKRAVPRDQIASARGRPTYMQQPRLFTGSQSARPLPEVRSSLPFALLVCIRKLKPFQKAISGKGIEAFCW